MKRFDFLKSLLGLTIAPMAIAKIGKAEKTEILYPNKMSAWASLEMQKDLIEIIQPMPLPLSMMPQVKEAQAFINGFDSTILRGI